MILDVKDTRGILNLHIFNAHFESKHPHLFVDGLTGLIMAIKKSRRTGRADIYFSRSVGKDMSTTATLLVVGHNVCPWNILVSTLSNNFFREYLSSELCYNCEPQRKNFV